MHILYTDSAIDKLSDFLSRNYIFVSSCIPRSKDYDNNLCEKGDCELKTVKAKYTNYEHYKIIELYTDVHSHDKSQIQFDHKINRGIIYDMSIIKNVLSIKDCDTVKSCPSGLFSQNYSYSSAESSDSECTSEGTSCGTSENLESDHYHWYVNDKPTEKLFPLSLHNKRRSFTCKKIRLRQLKMVIYVRDGVEDVVVDATESASSSSESFFTKYQSKHKGKCGCEAEEMCSYCDSTFTSSSSSSDIDRDDTHEIITSYAQSRTKSRVLGGLSPSYNGLKETSVCESESSKEISDELCLLVLPENTSTFDIERYDKTGVSVILDYLNDNYIVYDRDAIEAIEP